MDVPQDAPADAQHQRPMPPHQGRKGRLVTVPDETLQQLAVRQRAAAVGPDQSADVLQDVSQLSLRHGPGPSQARTYPLW